jgi:3-hydroxyacyl-CoA dehydrogenase/enoyl-CoA hydratase/3-hydroxybutyryl-CoA epimerase
MSVFKYEKDHNHIVTLTMDMTGSVNAMNREYRQAMIQTIERLQAETAITGLIIASAKDVFFAGGDLNELVKIVPEQREEFIENINTIKNQLRILEKFPFPVVAAINGAALGGGLEITLACNYRIAVNSRSVQLGLPEVSLGLLPGAGGVVRSVNLLGIEKALPLLLEGKNIFPRKAIEIGLIHEMVDESEQLIPAAKAYILANKDNPDAAIQPWDKKGHKIPAGDANRRSVAQLMSVAPALLVKKTKGLLPAPELIMDTAFQSLRLNFDTAQKVETENFAYLITTPEAKNMITAFFFQLNQIKAGANRPKDIPSSKIQRLGIIGAGMMGQGIAYVAAKAGIRVILKDVSVANAEKGKAYSSALMDKRILRGRASAEKKEQLLNLIQPTESNDDLSDCDLIIEAAFENIELKNTIIQSTQSHLKNGVVWGSNTSSLPINELAKASANPNNFIGIHFFSPVDKMPLIEIICGDKTSDETLAKAFDFAHQIKKTPIVVNDSLGFFTSRTFGTYLDEGGRLLVEGVHPIKIDNVAKAAGMPVGPLTVHDEVSLELTRKVTETWDNMGLVDNWGERDVMREIIQTLVLENNRGGRYHGGGFYEYPENGKKYIWPELIKKYHQPDVDISDADIKDRLLFRQIIETLKCLETHVLRSVADGNLGSIMGIGAPVHTGGFLQFINTYGLENFIDRCNELEQHYGPRFSVPRIVKEKLAAGEMFK